MNILKAHEKHIDLLINEALQEDIGEGDVTTDIVIPQSAVMKGVFVSKDEGVICGLPIVKKVFKKLDPSVSITMKKKDGDRVKNGDIIAVVKGKARALLMGERLSLNLLQQLSGVATTAAEYVKAVKPYGVTILDTRKTTPMMRIMEKYAVATGGATNHRIGLYDMVLIKNNHLMYIDLEKAVAECRRFIPKGMKVEIEVHDFDTLEKAMRAKPDIIMLDNMNPEQIKKALARMKEAGCGAKVELSGGIKLSNIVEYAKCKPDYISIGALTHSPRALDISLRLSR